MPRIRRAAATATQARPAAHAGDGDAATIQRWALLVGISRHAHPELNLRYAARDAEQLRDLLQQPTAGAFASDHVLALLDGDATLAGLNRALRTFLKRPAPNDLVLLFFACHGAHDPDRPSNLYLLPHDTDPADVSGTALPMREVELALRETLHARRVVLLMDACHSGGLASALAGSASVARRALGAQAQDFNQYMAGLSQAREGVSLMTSAMANEASQEGEQWGQGHGVFTHYVLEGLRGKADRGGTPGTVTVGKLFDYVAEQVQRVTDDRQHPHIDAAADRELPLAVLSASTAEQHLALARHLEAAALWLGEPVCWLGAATQLQRATQLQAGLADGALVHRAALALALAGERDAAADTWASLAPDDPVPGGAAGPAGAAAGPGAESDLAADPARAWQGLVGLAQAVGAAADAHALLVTPGPAAPWVPAVLASRPTRARRAALLVGLNRVDPAVYGGWEGEIQSPEPETRAFADHLQQQFGFDICIRLLGAQATLAALRQALQQLVQSSDGLESLVLLLSGHGGEMPDLHAPQGRQGTFVAYDGQLTWGELAAKLVHSRAAHTTVIASCAHSGHLAPLGRLHGFDVLTACAANQTDQDGQPYGPFVTQLMQHLRPGRTAAELEAALRAGMRRTLRQQQVPQIVLAPHLPPLLGGALQAASAPGADLARALLGGARAAEPAVLARALDLAAAYPLPPVLVADLVVAAAARLDAADGADRLGASDRAGPFAPLGPALEQLLSAGPGGLVKDPQARPALVDALPPAAWAAAVQAAVRLASPVLPWQVLAGLAHALREEGVVAGAGLAAVADRLAGQARTASGGPGARRSSGRTRPSAAAATQPDARLSPADDGPPVPGAGPGVRVLLVTVDDPSVPGRRRRAAADAAGRKAAKAATAASQGAAPAAVQALRDALRAGGLPDAHLQTVQGADATAAGVRTALGALLGRTLRGPWPPVLVYWCGAGDLGGLRLADGALLPAPDLVQQPGMAVALLADGVRAAVMPRHAPDLPPTMSVLLARSDQTDRSVLPLADNEAAAGRPDAALPLPPAAAALLRALHDAGGRLAALRVCDLEQTGAVQAVQLRGQADGTDRSQRLLADPLADLLLSWVQPLRRAGLAQALQALEAFAELRSGGDASLLLPLAVLRHAQGQADGALAALERAVALCPDEPRLRAQVHLMLGRVLLDSGRDRARAVSECHRALALDPTLSVARFWLGRAIAELIQRDTRLQAHQALTDYLSQGAPQGRRREALQLLDALGDVPPDATRPPL